MISRRSPGSACRSWRAMRLSRYGTTSAPRWCSADWIRGPLTGSRCGRRTWRAAATGRRPAARSPRPGLRRRRPTSRVRLSMTRTGGGSRSRWSPPADNGGEPVLGYRVTLSSGETFSGGGDFLSQFVPLSSDSPVSASVVASNSRGDSPAASGPTVSPFSRPAAVSGLALAASDGALAASWNPADSGQCHRSLRVPGGRRLLDAGRAGTERDDRLAGERPDLHRGRARLQRRDVVPRGRSLRTAERTGDRPAVRRAA